MIIRLIPPPPHPTILYALTFPSILSLHDLGPGAAIPPAWSSQLHILTSVLQLEPPSSIHMLDKAVGLVARVHEISMDVPHKEFLLRFVDGREIYVPMNSDCVRMLLGVVVDVKGCSEPESQRNSLEGSACPATAEGSPARPSKPGKHKRQRSLLFSLISSLVPKSFSSSSPPPPSSAPPPTPLPPLPLSGRITPSSPSQQTFPVSENPDLLRKRARATLIDVWRRHVVPALAPQHTPTAGYAEWTLIAMASRVRAEMESVEATNSHARGISNARLSGSRHRKVQSEGRKALDFGDRNDHHEPERRRCRPPSPFPGMFDTEDTDQVVYPRQGQADEWGVRYLHDVFDVEYNGYNDSLLGEHFTVGDDWDDTERLTFELSRVGHHGTHSSGSDDRHLYPADFGLDCNNNDGGGRLADMAFDMSRCPLVPSDVNDDESDDSQISLRTPEDEEYLPLAPPVQVLLNSAHDASNSAPRPSLVSRVSSSRPRPRNASAQYSSVPSMPQRTPQFPTPRTPPSSDAYTFEYRDMQVNELIASRLFYLEQICTALELVRSRAREEGWKLVRATSIGAKIGWMDDETEKSLEIKAKRRAWSSGIKISAPYAPCIARKVWDGSFRSPSRPAGLASSLTRTLQVRGPIVPTGLSLGVPVRSSPLAMHVWSTNDGQKPTLSQSGILNSAGHGMGTIEGKRSSRVTFSDNIVTKLFPLYEDEGEGSSEPAQSDAVGFPQAVPLSVSAEEPECSLLEGPAGREDDPFYFCPSRPRTRTTSMYMISPAPSAPSAPSSPVLPMFRPSTPPPPYQAAVSGDASAASNNEKFDTSALLLQPLSSLAISATSQPSQPPFISNSTFVPRPRAVSLPTPRSYSSTNKTRRTSFNHKEEYCEDLSQAYASPPPEGPLVVSATPAPHEQYPRYAHVQSPVPASKKSMNASFLGRTRKEVVFEQAGSEFTVGIEVALGRAEEGRVVW